MVGGANGSEAINNAVHESLAELLDFCNIVHQCGSGVELQTTGSLLRQHYRCLIEPRGAYWVRELLDAEELGDAYALASIAVSRSGAGTTNELAATATPSILVPLVPTGGDEQRKIAEGFRRSGAAVVIPNPEFGGPKLVACLRELFDATTRLNKMSEASRKLYSGNAAEALLRLSMRPTSVTS
jgi:UDP-N-acetylglucosamine--N-acetylmuramyl-(pentapeptide) pyrophosphoryl-undecaprenol N-acetylglucosamine transferase